MPNGIVLPCAAGDKLLASTLTGGRQRVERFSDVEQGDVVSKRSDAPAQTTNVDENEACFLDFVHERQSADRCSCVGCQGPPPSPCVRWCDGLAVRAHGNSRVHLPASDPRGGGSEAALHGSRCAGASHPRDLWASTAAVRHRSRCLPSTPALAAGHRRPSDWVRALPCRVRRRPLSLALVTTCTGETRRVTRSLESTLGKICKAPRQHSTRACKGSACEMQDSDARCAQFASRAAQRGLLGCHRCVDGRYASRRRWQVPGSPVGMTCGFADLPLVSPPVVTLRGDRSPPGSRNCPRFSSGRDVVDKQEPAMPKSP